MPETDSAPLTLLNLEFAPFKIRVSKEFRLPDGKTADALAELTWENRTNKFLIEQRVPGTPKQISEAISQLKSFKASYPDANLMVVTPYLSGEAMNRLNAENISGIDLSGNGLVTTPGEWFVLKKGAPNKYPSSVPIKNIYRGKSSLVCRSLFLNRKFNSVSALLWRVNKEAGVTQATVSKVLKTLEENLLVERTPKSIWLTQPEELLRRLSINFESPKVTGSFRGNPITGSLNTRPYAIVAALAEMKKVRYAVNSVLPYAPFPGSEETTVYVESLDDILNAKQLRENTRFPTVRVLETKDPNVYFDSRRFDALFSSPLQLYLELTNGTKREKEIGAVLLKPLLDRYTGEDFPF